ncbi:MAG: hypothetical protein AAGK78_16570, partial [Planctomycetota bacterium]
MMFFRFETIRARLQFTVVAATLFVAVACGLAIASIYGLLEGHAAFSRDRALYLERVDSARRAQVSFKKQVQNWKNVLLRGHTQKDFDRYWLEFETDEAEADRLLIDLAAMLPADDSSAALHGTLTRDIEEAVATHRMLGQRYRSAIALFNPDDPLSPRVVDAEVRGIDRAPTDAFD